MTAGAWPGQEVPITPDSHVYEELLDSVMRTTDVMLVLLDPQFNFVWVNPAYAATCCRRPEQLVGKNHFALYPHAENEAIFRRVRDTGEGVFHRNKPFVFPDQPERETTYWDWSLAPVKHAAGGVTGLVFSLRETTRFVRMQQALQESHASLERGVAERTAALQLANERLTRENEERLRSEQALRLEESRLEALLRLSRMTEAPLEEISVFTLEQTIALTGSRIGFVGHLSEDEAVYNLSAVSQDVLKECRVAGDPVRWRVVDAGLWADAIRERRTLFVNDYDRPHPRKRGLPPGHLPVERFMIVPLIAGGRIELLAGVGNKGSDYDHADERQVALLLSGMWSCVQRKQARDQLEAANRGLRALAGQLTLTEQRERRRMANVLHDHLQQLLVASKFRVAILGRAGDDLLRQGAEEVQELLDEAIASSRSLTAELSPPILQEGGLQAGLEWLARWMDDKHGLFVDLEMPAEPIPLAEDVWALLFESVRELLFNAVKHSRTRTAAVSARRVNGQVRVVVSDQGVGFDPASVPEAGRDGGGFGLFSIRQRLDLIGGRLEIQSAPGRGSRFVLEAPAASEPVAEPDPVGRARVTRPAAVTVPPPIRGAKIRVLLADDHLVMQQGLRQLLGREPDLEVVGGAEDGEQAIALAARLQPDVILMDFSMPGINGVEATRAIRLGHPGIRVIGLSMFEEAERARAMREAGAVGYVTKSGPADAVLAAIRGACRDRAERPAAAPDAELP